MIETSVAGRLSSRGAQRFVLEEMEFTNRKLAKVVRKMKALEAGELKGARASVARALLPEELAECREEHRILSKMAKELGH